MSKEANTNDTLKPIVVEWFREPSKWCFEEDGDSDHGKKQNLNKVERFKKDLGISRE
jgi:hypothetical protein